MDRYKLKHYSRDEALSKEIVEKVFNDAVGTKGKDIIKTLYEELNRQKRLLEFVIREWDLQKPNIVRSGEIFSIASSEFFVFFPDGTGTTIWSPVWHEMEPDEELEDAQEYANKIWEEKNENMS